MRNKLLKNEPQIQIVDTNYKYNLLKMNDKYSLFTLLIQKNELNTQ